MKFTSHPSVCSECGWPYKSTTLKCNAKKGTLVHTAHALSRVYLKTTDGVQTKFCEIHVLETVEIEKHIQIGCRIEMFSMNKLLQMVIFRNLSVLSS